MVLRKDHPFNPGEHKYSMILPIGGMILLGLTCLTLGFVLWPDPKPHYDTTTEGTPAGDVEATSDLPAGHDQRGARAMLDRKLEQTRERYQEELEQLLAAPDPGNPEWQHALLVSYRMLGDMALAAGNHEVARARFGEGLEVTKKLAAMDPDNVEWQLDLIGAELKLVTVHDADEKQAEARSHLAAARAVFARLEAAGLLRDDTLEEKPYMLMVEPYRKALLAHERKLAEPAGD